MKDRFPTQSPSYIFNRIILLVLLAVLLLSAWAGQVVIVILLGLVLSAAGLAMLWSRLSLKGIYCGRTLSEHNVFPGESVELQLKIVNRKLLPLPWIQVEDELPLGFTAGSTTTEANRPGYGFLTKSASLLWYTSATWREHLSCKKRGYYALGPITVTSGDIFGFYPRSLTGDIIDHITVYPVIYPITELAIPPLYPIGDTKAERRIFADPTRVIGVRDYTPHDSLRHIHWKATARHQNLQVKVFEPTTTLEVAIFLAADTFIKDAIFNEADFELGISTAASIANYVITEQRSSTGLFVNSRLADSRLPAKILPAGSTRQLVSILEALAKVTPVPSDTFEEYLQQERKSLPWGTSLILILGKPTDSLTGIIENLRESGYKIQVLRISQTENDALADGWHTIRQPGDLAGVA